MVNLEKIREALKAKTQAELKEIAVEIGVNFHTLISIRYATRTRHSYILIGKLSDWVEKQEKQNA